MGGVRGSADDADAEEADSILGGEEERATGRDGMSSAKKLRGFDRGR